MSKIDVYKRKKHGFDNLHKIILYGNEGITHYGNMPHYTISLKTDGHNPESDWFYAALEKLWPEIIKEMKQVGVKDVNKAKGEAAKEAGDFLGLVGV